MTQFIIHVGPQKTGVRYLQRAFAAMCRQLADRGVLYPPIWGEGAHGDLPAALSRLEPTLENQFTELRESGYPVVLLSAEELINVAAPGVAYLRTLTRRKNPVRIVFYVRSWAELLSAHWKHAAVAGDARTFREYLLAFANAPAEFSIINFAPALRPFAEQFGAYAIDIVAYDSVVAEQRDLFRHFAASFLDWPDAPKPDLPPVNVSPGVAEIEIVRALHGIEAARLGRRPAPAEARAMAERYLRRASEFASPALHAALAAHAATAPLDEVDLHLAQLHRDLFNEFREAVVAPKPSGVFFQPRRVEIPYIRRDFLLAPGVVGELHRIHTQVLAGLAPPGRGEARQGQANG